MEAIGKKIGQFKRERPPDFQARSPRILMQLNQQPPASFPQAPNHIPAIHLQLSHPPHNRNHSSSYHLVDGNLLQINLHLYHYGPMATFIRHIRQMQSPTFPRYVRTVHWPKRRLQDLDTAPTIANALEHQRYLEQLSYESLGASKRLEALF